MEEISKKLIPDESKELLIRALDATQQRHVSNYIHGNGEYVAEYEDYLTTFMVTESM